ncbi:MAG: DUF5130 domain-containing protein [Nocardioides sp.]|nr:DUF5130 domain-containing protein [Nocardioides sp.]
MVSALSSSERSALDAAIRQAEQTSRAEFSVFVGPVEGDAAAFARRLHRAMTAPTISVLVMVDPDARVVEVVTGSTVRRTLSDAQVELGMATMLASFRDGELVEGLRRGLAYLAEHARPSLVRHAAE